MRERKGDRGGWRIRVKEKGGGRVGWIGELGEREKKEQAWMNGGVG